MKYVDIDAIYRKMPLENIPWNVESPPGELVELVTSGRVKRCKTVDLGCGAGNYAIYLATKGFDVTGIDGSSTAIRIAKENSTRKGVKCQFVVADLISDLNEISETFDFAYDWEVLHHIFPEDRDKYVQNVHRLTNPGAKYLSVCFSDRDTAFGDTGKYRETPIGTRLYFSSENELRQLFGPYFKIVDLRTIEVRGKSAPHQVNYVLMERRQT
jgi:SAM-dependent methyltransferase